VLARSEIRLVVDKASTILDLYAQAIDASKLKAQKDMALAITSNQMQVN
jgi:hypothetical protein